MKPDNYIVDDNGCWIWQGAVQPRGYGTAGRKLAHRLSYEVRVGPIPDGLLVCHRCDVRRCINPDHLFLGTAHDNTQDMMAKGRHRSSGLVGDQHPQCSITEAQAFEIRALLTEGRTRSAVAQVVGTTADVVGHIASGVTWRHLGEPTWSTRGRPRLRTHCPQGHPYDNENTYVTRAGTRQCVACKREQNRSYRKKAVA